MVTKVVPREKHTFSPLDALSDLKNVGPVTRKCFPAPGIETLGKLATQGADDLYRRLSERRSDHADPRMHDTFSATIHQVRNGDALPWSHISDARKQRPMANAFPMPQQEAERR